MSTRRPARTESLDEVIAGQAIGSFVVDRIVETSAWSRTFSAHARDGGAVSLEIPDASLGLEAIGAFVRVHERLAALAEATPALLERGLPRVLAAGAEPIAFAASEQVSGRRASERIWLPMQAIGVGLELLGLLCALHRDGAVHGALRASSVIVTDSGGIVLRGFGHAALALHGVTKRRDSRLLAPALREGAPAISLETEADVWGTCAVLVELMTGASPLANTAWRSSFGVARPAALDALLDVVARGLQEDAEARGLTLESLSAKLAAIASEGLGRDDWQARDLVRAATTTQQTLEPVERTIADDPATAVSSEPTLLSPGSAPAVLAATPDLITTAPVESRPLEHGAVVHRRYAIEVKLGEGGMGAVYKAYDLALERHVALKILGRASGPGQHEGGSLGLARVFREARAAAAVVHPNVVAVHDVVEVDGVACIVMEHIHGETVRSLLVKGRLSVDERMRIVREVAKGLYAAHQVGVVHLDVKPENVMVARDGAVKVLDFGIGGRFLSGESMSPGHGTPRYMAPEQVLRGAVDARTDQYSWGAFAFEVITGRVLPPAAGRLSQGLTIAWPRDIPSIGHIIRRAVQLEPSERFPSLAPILALLANESRPQRSRLLGALAIVLVGLLAVTGWIGATRQSLAPPVAPSAPPAPARARAHVEAARKAWLDGSLQRTWSEAQEALAIDPESAAAHLVFVVAMRLWPDDATRSHFRAAQAGRDTLSLDDRAYVEAVAPAMTTPPNFQLAAERLGSIHDRMPSDLTVAISLAEMWISAGNLDRAGAVLQSVTAPASAPGMALSDYADVLGWRDDLESARRLLQRCADDYPAADVCLQSQVVLELNEGNCVQAERALRAQITASPEAPDPHLYLAYTLDGLGKDAREIRPVLETWARSSPPPIRERNMIRVEIRMALLEGRLREAAQLSTKLGEMMTRVDDDTEQFDFVMYDMLLQSEIGEDTAARARLDHYVASRQEYRRHAFGGDNVLYLQAVAAELRILPWREWIRIRDAGLSAPRDREHLLQGRARTWLEAFATAASTQESASAALREFPNHAPLLARYERWFWHDAATARVYALTGHQREARPYFERAARSCGRLEDLVDHMRGLLDFADTLEHEGEQRGACAQYARILKSWPALSGSKSAARAADRFAHHCGAIVKQHNPGDEK